MSTIISVTGTAEARHPSERGTVRVVVAIEGGDRRTVTDAAARRHAEVTAGVRALHDAEVGPVTWWSSDQVRVSAERPWNADGKQLPLVYRSASGLSVEFDDFTRLSEWVTDVVQVEGVGVAGIVWALTDQQRDQLTERIQDEAVRDAVAKAQRYAGSLGLGDVSPVAISDPGLLDGAVPLAEPVVHAARMMSAGGSPSVELVPEEIVLSATVHARFSAE